MNDPTIWKYPFPVADVVGLVLPLGTKPIHVDVDPADESRLALWAEVIPSAPTATRYLAVYGTGHPLRQRISGIHQHLGTVIARGGLVWHVYDLGTIPPAREHQ